MLVFRELRSDFVNFSFSQLVLFSVVAFFGFAQDSDAPHATGLSTQHFPTPRTCVSHLSLRLVVCRLAVSCHSWYHSFIQQCHSARAARARPGDTRDTSHAVHLKPLFLKVVRSARAPFLLRLLLCFSAASLSLSSLTSPRTVTWTSFSSVACGGLHAHVRRYGPAGRSSRR